MLCYTPCNFNYGRCGDGFTAIQLVVHSQQGFITKHHSDSQLEILAANVEAFKNKICTDLVDWRLALVMMCAPTPKEYVQPLKRSHGFDISDLSGEPGILQMILGCALTDYDPKAPHAPSVPNQNCEYGWIKEFSEYHKLDACLRDHV